MGTRDGLDAVQKKASAVDVANFIDTDTNSRTGKLLLAFGSTVLLGSGSRGTHGHIVLSHDSHWYLY
jgi:hypothetical protein